MDAALLLARVLVPQPMRPGWADALRMSASLIPHARLMSIDARLEHATARPVIVPDAIVIDRGKVFVSSTFIAACRTLGITVQPAGPATPTDKGIVERTFSSVNTLFCQHVAGYVGSDVTRRGDGVQAAWTIRELADLFEGLSREIGPGRHHRRDSDDTAGWMPAAVTRLAALAGTTATALLRALPVLQAVASAGQGPPLPPWHAHACLLCAARRGASGLAIIRVFPHERICGRHSRWHGGGPQRPLRDLLPEIPHANALHRRLARRQGTAAVTEHFLQAQAQTRQWLAGGGPADLKPSWERRLGLLGEDPYGDPHRPSPDRIELVTYPETVTMTKLAIMHPGARTGSAAGYAAPDMLE